MMPKFGIISWSFATLLRLMHGEVSVDRAMTSWKLNVFLLSRENERADTWKHKMKGRVWRRAFAICPFGFHKLSNVYALLYNFESIFRSTWSLSLFSLHSMCSLVQWNWFSDVTGCMQQLQLQWRRWANFTAPGCTCHLCALSRKNVFQQKLELLSVG